MKTNTKFPKLAALSPEVVALNAILATILLKLDQKGVWPSKDSLQFLEDLTKISWNKGDLIGASAGQDVFRALEGLTRTKSKGKQKS